MRQEKMQNENLIKKELKLPNFKSWDLETKKEAAKIGMTASMAIVVGTSFGMKSKIMKNLHIGAGVALVGFSLWHHMLYQPSKKSSAKMAQEAMVESEMTPPSKPKRTRKTKSKEA
jgi:hypothetical protein